MKMITAGRSVTVSPKTNRTQWPRLREIAVIVIALLFILPACADLKYVLVSREIVMQRLQDAPMKNSDRVTELEKMFREAGCNPTEEPVKGLHQPNVLCVLPGSSDSMIVVGGHLDHVEEGTGVIDDWSGASMLPSLYQSLASHPRTHTFLFIGFAGEEDGLVGSDFYTKNLKLEQRKQIAAMVNLECLGIGKTELWTSHSEPILIRMLVALAQSMKIPLGGINVEQVGTTDSESFARYHIPRITITAITQNTLQLLHTRKDNIAAINPELYYESYRLIAPYLVLLDQQLPTDGSPIEPHK
jgi:hypothetical protein